MIKGEPFKSIEGVTLPPRVEIVAEQLNLINSNFNLKLLLSRLSSIVNKFVTHICQNSVIVLST